MTAVAFGQVATDAPCSHPAAGTAWCGCGTGQQVGEPPTGHTDKVTAVAFGQLPHGSINDVAAEPAEPLSLLPLHEAGATVRRSIAAILSW